MNQQKTKLLRPLFADKRAFRRFKRAYIRGGEAKRLQVIEVAKRARATGDIHHVEAQ